jgi:uncharacterized protein (TIGR00297 family)
VADSITRSKLNWQSKLVLLAVVPYTAISVIFQARYWALHSPAITIWTLGWCAAFGFAAWRSHSASADGAVTGATIAASLMFSTLVFPYRLWQTGLIPVLAVLLLTSAATRFGRVRKERLGTAEKRLGRGAAQVAANLGMAALLFEPKIRSWMSGAHLPSRGGVEMAAVMTVGLAALAEAAADTVSSEVGQVLGGQPRMITTFRKAEAGTDGAISFAGTLAGTIAAGMVSGVGSWALRGDVKMFALSWAAGVFGLIVDSFLGASLERRGWLNNDAVNFLSTGSAAGFVVGMVSMWPRLGLM